MKKLSLFLMSLALLFTLVACSTKVTVTFDPNNGDVTQSVEVVVGTTISFPEEPVKEGYTFKGWFLDNQEFTSSSIFSKNVTLVAKWEKNIYTIEYFVNDIIIISDGYQKYDSIKDKDKIDRGYEGYIDKTFVEGLKIEIKCQVNPDNATIKDLIYVCEESDDYKLIVNNDGTATIEFYRGRAIDLIIKSADIVGFTKKILITIEDLSDIFG